MAVSPWLASDHAGPAVDLNQLVNGGTPNGVLFIMHNGERDYADARLAVAANDSVAGDYQPGSVQLYQIANAGFASGSLLRGAVNTGVWEEYGIAEGDINKVLTVTSDTLGSEAFEWILPPEFSITLSGEGGIHVTGSPGNLLTAALYGTGEDNAVVDGDILVGNSGEFTPLAKGENGQFLKIDDLGVVTWGTGDGGGTVTSVGLEFVSDINPVLEVTGSPITTSGTFSLAFTTPSQGEGGALPYWSYSTIPQGVYWRSMGVAMAEYALSIASLGSGSLLAFDFSTSAFSPTPNALTNGEVLTYTGVGDTGLEWKVPAGAFGTNDVLDGSGQLTVVNPDITEDAVIAATSRGNSTITAASGPLTIQVTGGVGFVITGDGANDSGRGVSYIIHSL